MAGCFRFSNEGPLDAAPDDAPNDVSGDIIIEAEAGSKVDASDASADGRDGGLPGDALTEAPPPICQRFDPVVSQAIAGDLVSQLLQDCRIRNAFASLPPVRLQHFQECMAAQVASVLGCVHADGTRFKYPAYDSMGQFCRDMKTAHADLAASDGDFDAFLAGISFALSKNGLTDDEIARALRTFGAATTRADIVKLKDAGPTQPCDAGVKTGPEAGADAGPDVSADAAPDALLESGPDSSPRDGAADAPID